MTCLPRAAEADRTVLETVPVDDSNGWWTGLVRDRDHETGEIRLRMERWVRDPPNHGNPHTWRVRPDFWAEERDAVADFDRQGGTSPLRSLPISDRFDVLAHRRVRKDDVRWVAVVRLNPPHKAPLTRLYHWDPTDGAVRQKWTVGQHWGRLQELATERLEAPC